MRAHLESLVLPLQQQVVIPADAENGLTEEIFDKLSASGQVRSLLENILCISASEVSLRKHTLHLCI